MDLAEKEKIEKGEIPSLLRRLDFALYACWVVIEDKHTDSVKLRMGSKEISFPSSQFFVDSMLDAGCLASRKLLHFLGIGVSQGSLAAHSGRTGDIKITEWPGGQLSSPLDATKVLLPDFSEEEITACFLKALRMADKAIAHLTSHTVAESKPNIIQLGVCFWAVRRLIEQLFYGNLLRRDPPTAWLPPGFNTPANRAPWRFEPF